MSKRLIVASWALLLFLLGPFAAAQPGPENDPKEDTSGADVTPADHRIVRLERQIEALKARLAAQEARRAKAADSAADDRVQRLEKEIEQLETIRSSLLSLDRVERIAREELGLKNPKDNQIIWDDLDGKNP